MFILFLCVKRVSLVMPFLCLIFFLYIYIMEQLTKAELWGKLQELQYENKQLLNQLKLQSNGN